MSTLRRLISLCLVLAFASYGAVVAAPAHAHDDHRQQGALHAVALDMLHVDHGHGHDSDHHDDDHHNAGADHMDDHIAGKGDPGNSHDHDGFHVHAVPAFTTGAEPLQVSQPLTTTQMIWTDRASIDVSGLFSPLKKPPRTFL